MVEGARTDLEQASESPPPPVRDRAFWGMTSTQFLGAFNDNLFKQLVLLICTDYVRRQRLDHDPYQMYAQGAFALAFVLFSGSAGWLSDRISKRRIVVLSKVAEIVVMAAGVAVFAFFTHGEMAYLWALMAVLLLMGVQSAFFGPAKYGILPELFPDRDLPFVNGMVQMTTFLAIIFGTAVCGLLKDKLEGAGVGLWPIGVACVGIAVIGTVTSLLVRRTPVADPDARFGIESVALNSQTWSLLMNDRELLKALAATVLFWFLGGVALPTVNAYGKYQLRLSDTSTSILTACIGFGIAVGCVTAGLVSRDRVQFGLVQIGAAGMFLTFALLGLLPFAEGLAFQTVPAAGLLIGLGICAGLYAVPLQVFLQTRPPSDQKGRMIGGMNLFTWIGILASAAAYGLFSHLFTNERISSTFFVLGLLALPMIVAYRPSVRPDPHPSTVT